MFPPEKPKMDPKDYERVKTNELLNTVIDDIQLDEKHPFKGFQGKPDTIQSAVRFKFMIEGMKFHKYSRWMKFMYSEKSTLYSKYIVPLVSGIKPEAKFDIEHLRGMKVKTLWRNNGDFQNLEIIVPANGMVPYTSEPCVKKPADEEVPF